MTRSEHASRKHLSIIPQHHNKSFTGDIHVSKNHTQDYAAPAGGRYPE
jgi:hypothetical protein